MLGYLSYDPFWLDVGFIEISPHGVMIAVGVVVGARYLLPRAAERGIVAEQVLDAVTWALVGAMIGARLAYVLNHGGDYADRPLDVLRLWEGGFSLLGGLGGAIVTGYPKLRRMHIPFWRFMDVAVPGIALGIAVGRIGDLMIADHLGKPTEFFLGYACPDGRTGSPCIAPPGGAVHQTALYDMVGAAVVFALLVVLSRRRRREGALTLVFAVGYGAVRFVEGFFRIDVTHGTGLNGSQWTALVVGLVAAVALVIVRRRPLDTPAVAETARAHGDPRPTVDRR
ncbi:MAG: prolipoprotein diacylglyceryl transferase [Acidimicrobiia bacterium]